MSRNLGLISALIAGAGLLTGCFDQNRGGAQPTAGYNGQYGASGGYGAQPGYPQQPGQYPAQPGQYQPQQAYPQQPGQFQPQPGQFPQLQGYALPGQFPQPQQAYPQQPQPGAPQAPGPMPQQGPSQQPPAVAGPGGIPWPSAFPIPGQPPQPGQNSAPQQAPGQMPPQQGQPSPGSATPIDPNLAGAVATIPLMAFAQQQAPGMQREGAAVAGQFAEGQTLDTTIQLQPNKCYTILAMGAGVRVVNITLVATTPIPGMSPTLAQDSGSNGPSAALGGGGNCYRWQLPVAANAKFVVKATQGGGIAAAQVYSR